MQDQPNLERGSKIQKVFNYKKGIVNLDFTLRVDIKTELKDFMDLLKAAENDVQAELDKFN